MAEVIRRLPLLLLLPGLALAGQLLQGDRIRIHYGEAGLWNDPDTGAGLQFFDTAEAQWLDITWPGTAWADVFIGYTQDGTAHTVLSSAEAPEWTVESAADTATADILIATHRFTAGELQLDRVESFAIDGTAIWTEWTLTNTGSTDITDLRLTFSLDADPDADAGSNDQPLTYNDTLDLDNDAVSEWVQSEGMSTGVTIGFGACDAAQEVGHSAETDFVADPDLALTDEEGGLADYTMNLRHTVSTLAAGDAVTFSLVTALGSTAAAAQAAYLDVQEEACGILDLDRDNDGFESDRFGGDDCDDDDDAVHPGAEEVWYDGVDADCDGNDSDADGDGFASEAVEGEDCDDADPDIHPEAEEVWYDGVDADCDDNDEDADGDGFDRAEDCDDADPTVSPAAEEVWYDGDDTDCDGASDYDADRDGYRHEDYGGDDCDDNSADIHPGMTETWYDGYDADCDGASDYDADADGHDTVSLGGDDCDDTDPAEWRCQGDLYGGGGAKCGTAGGGGLLVLLPLLMVRRRRQPPSSASAASSIASCSSPSSASTSSATSTSTGTPTAS